MNIQSESIDYFVRVSRLIGALQRKMQSLFPNLNLTEFGHYDEASRLSPKEFKAAVWRYNKLELVNSIAQFNELKLEPIAEDLRRLKPQIEGISLDGLMDSMSRLNNMLSRCTQYTSGVDPFDESGVFINIIGGIDELTYNLHNIADMINGLLKQEVNQGNCNSRTEVRCFTVNP